MKATSMSRIWPRTRLSVARLLHDRSGIAATEFAVIVPVMLVMFFGTVEISNGSVDRKITLTARTLSDLTSQAAPSSANAPDAPVTDSYLQNVFTASVAIVQPYCATPTQARLSEIYVDSNQVAKIKWSKAATIPGCGVTQATQATLTNSTRNAGDVVTTLVPATLLVKQTYLLLSELSYLYTPAVGYVMGKAGVTLSDVAYTRPRQAVCVVYTVPNPWQPNVVANNNNCPES
jgi:Flp pilus assembly protein TadG